MSQFLIGDSTDMMGSLTTVWAASLFILVPGIIWGGWPWWVALWPFVVIFALAALWWIVFIFLARFVGAIFGAIFK